MTKEQQPPKTSQSLSMDRRRFLEHAGGYVVAAGITGNFIGGINSMRHVIAGRYEIETRLAGTHARPTVEQRSAAQKILAGTPKHQLANMEEVQKSLETHVQEEEYQEVVSARWNSERRPSAGKSLYIALGSGAVACVGYATRQITSVQEGRRYAAGHYESIKGNI